MENISGAFLIQFLILTGALIGVWVRLQTKLKEIDMRMTAMEQEMKHADSQNEQVMKKLDRISEQIFEVKLQLNNKQDRE
jgi:uncharacterized protein YoxC